MKTRQGAGLMNIVKPTVRLDVRANFFSVRAVDGGNCVPENLKMAKAVTQFKKLYRENQPQQ